MKYRREHVAGIGQNNKLYFSFAPHRVKVPVPHRLVPLYEGDEEVEELRAGELEEDVEELVDCGDEEGPADGLGQGAHDGRRLGLLALLAGALLEAVSVGENEDMTIFLSFYSKASCVYFAMWFDHSFCHCGWRWYTESSLFRSHSMSSSMTRLRARHTVESNQKKSWKEEVIENKRVLNYNICVRTSRLNHDTLFSGDGFMICSERTKRGDGIIFLEKPSLLAFNVHVVRCPVCEAVEDEDAKGEDELQYQHHRLQHVPVQKRISYIPYIRDF